MISQIETERAAPEQLRDFAACVFEPRDLLELRLICGGPNKIVEHEWLTTDELPGRADELQLFNSRNRFNVFVSANSRSRRGDQRTKAKDCRDDRPCGKCLRCTSARFLVLFCDFDNTSIEAALQRIDDVSLPRPTLVAWSGHGVHAYWRLAEPIASESAWRGRMEALAALLQSDPAVCEPARVMRLPGFTNHKSAPVETYIVESDAARQYDLCEFPEPKPSTTRSASRPTRNGHASRDTKIALEALAKLNPARAESYEAWLTVGMILQSVDDSDELLAAWDQWSAHSEKYEPGACGYKWSTFGAETYNGARGPLTLGTLIQWARQDSGDSQFATLRDEAAKDSSAEQFIERPDPLPLAEHFLKAKFRNADGAQTLYPHRADFWSWDGARYKPQSDEAIDAAIYQHLETVKTPRRNQAGEPERDSEGRLCLATIRPRAAMVREIRSALPSRGLLLDDSRNAPFWIAGGAKNKPAELVAVQNGILHVPTRELLPASPNYFCTHALDYPYRPDAPPARHWPEFLESIWGDDAEAIALLQEWFGYVLTLNLTLHKMLLLVGPKRSGKGTIGRVLTALLGAANVAGPTLSSLTERFGLAPLLHKPLAIISDARLSGRADSATVAERLLAVSGEDAITIDVKHRDPITCTLPTRFMLLTNELPRIIDSSGALASRFLILTLRTSFYGREDTGLTARLLTELPSILLWALDGWDRLHEQGRFTEPQSSIDAAAELDELGSPVGAFVHDSCSIRPGASIVCSDLYAAWRTWCESNGRDNPGTLQSFSRDLHAAASTVRTTRPRGFEGERLRHFEGIELRT